MGGLDKVHEKRRRARFPWIPLILLLGTIYLFWVLPRMMPAKPVKVEFGNSDSADKS